MFEPRQKALITERKLQQSFDKISFLNSNSAVSKFSCEVPRLHRNVARKSDNLIAALIDNDESSSKSIFFYFKC